MSLFPLRWNISRYLWRIRTAARLNNPLRHGLDDGDIFGHKSNAKVHVLNACVLLGDTNHEKWVLNIR